ncbi:MAG: hypothetical protein B1H04_01685 [Planctomycetales bacterium 4484_123]|nr:MAG: hypothetical protein B1H04_01685 [Planctomycetales bacterium 4484_123]
MNESKPAILIIDDDPGVCWALAAAARSMGYEAQTAADAAEGMAKLAAGGADVVVLDIQLPGLNGLEALPRIKADHPALPVVVITAFGTVETAVEAVKRGAFDYLLKPVDMETLKTVLAAAVGRRRGQRPAQPPPQATVSDSEIVGRCPAMQQVFKQIALVAASDMPVLIQGETGTGKELVARAIHRYSRRCSGPFVAVNCSLLAGDLVASELFGHEKGAFTGADRAAAGKVEMAEGGTLLLDEIGDLSEAGQGRLLRFLDGGEFYRVGSAEVRRADVRILAAANRPLRAAALAGRFRRDLFFRVSGVTVELPPLRDRPGDVDLLIDHFLAQCGAVGITDEARAALNRYSFPGNVRELRNAVARAVTMAGPQPVGLSHLPEAIARPAPIAEAASLEHWAELLLEEVLAADDERGYEHLMARWERPLLAAAMKRFRGNQARMAGALRMHRTTLRKKLRAYGLIEGGSEADS